MATITNSATCRRTTGASWPNERTGLAPQKIIVTDTVPISQEKADAVGKLTVLSVAGLIGEAIHRIHNNESVSSLFLMENGRR